MTASRLWTDLQPAEGRLAGSILIATLVVLISIISMIFTLPEAALSCYIVFFAYRDNAADQMATALKLLVAVSLAILIAAWMLNHVADNSMARLFAICGFTFVGMYLSQATRAGSLAGTVGFIFAFMLTLPDLTPDAELLSQGLRRIWFVIGLPLILLLLSSVVAGENPTVLVNKRIAERLKALADPQSDRARALLDEGMEKVDEYLKLAKTFGYARGRDLEQLTRRADDSYYRLALAEAGISVTRSEGAPGPEKKPFFHADAFTNPHYVGFGLKIVVAAMATYIFYTLGGMFEIHTAMITCYFVAMGNTGQTHERIALRLTGCLLGAIVGLFAIGVVFPHMNDVGQFAVTVGIVTFCAAWISLGSERISYAGWQMALCFFLVAFHSFGPPTDISAITHRILGILVGSFTMWVVFAFLWPASAQAEGARELELLGESLATAQWPTTGRAASRLREPLARATRLARAARFEDGSPVLPVERARSEYLRFLRDRKHA